MSGLVMAVMMARDEQDVIGHVIEHLLEEDVDRVIVADNLSTDGTRDILEDKAREHGWHVAVTEDLEVGYLQSAKMTALADRAREEGAEWAVPVDADELWYAPDRLGVWLRNMNPELHQVHAPLYNHLRTAADMPDNNPFLSMVWRQPDEAPMRKVAFRCQPGAVIHQGNHAVTLPDPGLIGGGLAIRHFPARSAAHFVHKAIVGKAAYDATNLPMSEGAHWRSYGQIVEQHGEQALVDVFNTHWYYPSPVDEGLIRDPAPFRRWTRTPS